MTQSKHLKLPRTSGAFPNSFLNVFGNFLINAETAEVRTSPKMEGKRTCLRVRNEIKCPHANTRLVGLDAPKR